MEHFEYNIDLLSYGNYHGGKVWNKEHSEIDNCYKLYYISKGNISIYDKHSKYILKEGNFYFINGYKLSKQVCEKEFNTIWLHFRPRYILISEFLSYIDTVYLIEQKISNHIEDNDIILNYNKDNLHSYIYKTYKLQNIIQSCVLELMKKFNFINYKINPITQKILPAINYIENNYAMDIKLKDIADKCMLSPNHFHNLFKQVMHITPNQYIMQKRMNVALCYLQNATMEIKEISFELGFCNAAYFCRAFKKFYNLTPKQYQFKNELLIP